MMNQYETVFILTPVLPEEQVKDAVEKFKQVLAEQNAEILHEEDWGLRKLAYPIRKKSTGFYTLLQFKAAPEVVKALETEYRRDERVMRHLVVKLDKYAIEYAARRIAKKFGKSEETVT